MFCSLTNALKSKFSWSLSLSGGSQCTECECGGRAQYCNTSTYNPSMWKYWYPVLFPLTILSTILSVRWVACQAELSIAPAWQEPALVYISQEHHWIHLEHRGGGGVDVLARGAYAPPPPPSPVDTPRLYSGNGARNYEARLELGEKGGAGGSSEQDTQLCSQLAREIPRHKMEKKSRVHAQCCHHDALLWLTSGESSNRKYEKQQLLSTQIPCIDHSKYSCES